MSSTDAAEVAGVRRQLAIAGVGLRLRLDDAALAGAIDSRTGVYRTDSPPPQVYELDLAMGQPVAPTDRELHRYTRVEDDRFRLDRGRMLGGVVSLGQRGGSLAVAPSRLAVDSLLRLLLNLELPRVRGALVHAAGVVWEGEGLMFPGVSGAGKSTLAGAAGGDPLLSDEMVAVRPDAGGWRLFGTPFHGDLMIDPQAGDWPLKAVIFPDRRLPLGIERVSSPAALGRLMQTVVNYGDDPEIDRRLLDVAASIAQEVPCYTLSYRKGEPVRPLIQEVLAA